MGIGLIPEVFTDKIRVVGNGAWRVPYVMWKEEGAMDLAEDIVKISSEIGLSQIKLLMICICSICISNAAELPIKMPRGEVDFPRGI